MQLARAPPNPILDNSSDLSNELSRNYRYPNFKTAKAPYWKAWPEPTKQKLAKHDDMEMAMSAMRDLEFKLREAWTRADKPFLVED